MLPAANSALPACTTAYNICVVGAPLPPLTLDLNGACNRPHWPLQLAALQCQQGAPRLGLALLPERLPTPPAAASFPAACRFAHSELLRLRKLVDVKASATAQSTNLWSVLLPSRGSKCLACSPSASSTWLARLTWGRSAPCNALLAPAHVHGAIKSKLFFFCHAATRQ